MTNRKVLREKRVTPGQRRKREDRTVFNDWVTGSMNVEVCIARGVNANLPAPASMGTCNTNRSIHLLARHHKRAVGAVGNKGRPTDWTDTDCAICDVVDVQHAGTAVEQHCNRNAEGMKRSCFGRGHLCNGPGCGV